MDNSSTVNELAKPNAMIFPAILASIAAIVILHLFLALREIDNRRMATIPIAGAEPDKANLEIEKHSPALSTSPAPTPFPPTGSTLTPSPAAETTNTLLAPSAAGNINTVLPQPTVTPAAEQPASQNLAESDTVNPAEALYKKGLQYYLGGKGVSVQQARGMELFQQAANQQVPEAEARMAVFSHYGWGGDIDFNGLPSIRVEMDPQLAENLAENAIKQGLIARAASLGGDSAVTLGDLYLRGIGVKEDDSKAIEQYTKAANQGLAEAQYDLGFCYSQGEGVAQDKAEAAKFYRKAADRGLAEAQTALGLCYETGDGVQKDMAQAIKYYQKAANQGEPAAIAVIRLRFSQ
jgi:TPR repeat protein